MIRYLINTYHNFYPRSPYGERLDGSKSSIEEVSFLSTLSLRRATYWSCVPVVGRSFLSTLSLRRATCYCSGRATSHRPFLSTLSLRRATGIRPGLWRAGRISIHALLTESDFQRSHTLVPLHISIHALLTESDQCQRGCFCDTSNFYPRSPYGERRHDGPLRWVDMDFYPRSPYGERLYTMTTIICTASFLSTLSLRRATRRATGTAGSLAISIHALLTESDHP